MINKEYEKKDLAITNKEYEKKLDRFLDLIFAEMDHKEWTPARLALASRVSLSTVSRINHRITRLPRLKTIMLLATAVGMELDLTFIEAKKKKVA